MSDKQTLNEIQTEIENLKKKQYELENKALEIETEVGGSVKYSIRPAGRHVLTIGEELIQDQYAAVVELVKNAYDADSPDVEIKIERQLATNKIIITIQDHGIGMSTEDIVNKWLVPSTSNKMQQKLSKAGRIVQGRKGIGRYAASILGESFSMESVTDDGKKSSLSFSWEEFKKYEYLDQVGIVVKAEKTTLQKGTKITVIATGKDFEYWNNDKIKNLKFELKKLVPPRMDYLESDDFQIKLNIVGFLDYENSNEIIEPFPILELFDYRISGAINEVGRGILKYENSKVKNVNSIEINVDYGIVQCGKIDLDIRVYDRDKDSIDLLIKRGLKDKETNEYVSKTLARSLIDSSNGIGVYRNGFRIRPLGDPDFDWLRLNEKRVQNPSLRIGSNQVVGYVHVQSEELSGLEEKSARDGLKDNISYDDLKRITSLAIGELEQRRFSFRRQLETGKEKKKVEKKLDGLYDSSALQKSISTLLKKAGLSDTLQLEVEKLIQDEQEEKNKTIDDIKEIVAIYQGQATLGKIINVILHEGRRPLNYFNNQIPNLEYYIRKFDSEKSDNYFDKILNITEGIGSNSKIFAELFSRLDPLAAKKRTRKTKFVIQKIINRAIDIFEKELNDLGVEIIISGDEKLEYFGWNQDFYIIFANLLDNSIYWIKEGNVSSKKIEISISYSSGLMIDIYDSGPGISEELLESGIIFEPEFSTKTGGTGLGLAIAGEAATRNRLELTAVNCVEGAHFKLQEMENEENV